MFKETKSWNMSSFEVSTEDLQGIYGGVGKICPALPQIGLKKYKYNIFFLLGSSQTGFANEDLTSTYCGGFLNDLREGLIDAKIRGIDKQCTVV